MLIIIRTINGISNYKIKFCRIYASFFDCFSNHRPLIIINQLGLSNKAILKRNIHFLKIEKNMKFSILFKKFITYYVQNLLT